MLYAVFRHLETWSRTSSLKVVAPHLLNAGIPGGLQFCRSPRLRTTMRQRRAQSVCWRPFSPTYCTKGLGHAATALLTGAKSGLLTTVAWSSDFDSRLV